MQRELFNPEPVPVEVALSPAQAFLDRKNPEGYDAYWLRMLKDTPRPKTTVQASLLIFELGGQHFALSAKVLVEVMRPQIIYPIPHATHSILLGLVKVQGDLQLAISLEQLIFSGSKKQTVNLQHPQTRFVVVHDGQEGLVFPVQKILGVHACDMNDWNQGKWKGHTSLIGQLEFSGQLIGVLNHMTLFEQLKYMLKEP